MGGPFWYGTIITRQALCYDSVLTRPSKPATPRRVTRNSEMVQFVLLELKLTGVSRKAPFDGYGKGVT